jgi:hypothetical protein
MSGTGVLAPGRVRSPRSTAALSWQLVATYRRWQRRGLAGGPMSPNMQRQAVEAASALVSSVGASKVNSALAMIGCQRVSELSDGDVPPLTFMAALAP